MSNPEPFIFISHSSQDNDFALNLANQLRDAGFKVWLDLDSIEHGERWLDAIQRGVEGCSALVVVMSRVARTSEWVERETLVALQRRIPLFIALIEDIPLPVHLIDRQYTDFRVKPESALKKLVKVLNKANPPRANAKSVDVSPYADKETFFEYLHQMDGGKAMVMVARDLYHWGTQEADSVEFAGKHTPGMHIRVQQGEGSVILFSVWAYLRHPAVQIPFDYLAEYPPYDKRDLRISTLRSLGNFLPTDEAFDEGKADRRPTLPLLALDTAEKLENFKAIASEIINNLRGV